MTQTITIYSNPPNIGVSVANTYSVTLENRSQVITIPLVQPVIEIAGAGMPGLPGMPGTDGVGVPTGGATGYILTKKSAANNDTEWAAPVVVLTSHNSLTGVGTITHAQIDTALARLAGTSGNNSGDQDLTGLAHTNRTALDAVSGTNTGDETASGIRTKLGITTLSGANSGDQDLTGLVPKTTTVNGKGLSGNITLSAADVGADTAGAAAAVTAMSIGLGNVTNTSDANKPVSTAQQTAINAKENLLGNPATDGLVLASTAAGTRSWVAQAGGGTFDMLSTLVAAEISITGATTATIGRMHVCSGTTADYTVTLPAVTGNAGKLIGFRMASTLTKLVTLDGNASETIDAALTMVMWSGEAVILLCDGANWFSISSSRKTMSCKMRISVSQNFAAGTATLLALNTVVSEVGPTMASASGNRITVLRDGNYSLRAGAQFNNNNTSTNLRLITSIYKNGALLTAETCFAPASSYFQTVAHTVVRLIKGDYIQAFLAFTVGSYTSKTIFAIADSAQAESALEVVEL